MAGKEIRIRLAEEEQGFVYSILRDGVLLETAVVRLAEEQDEEIVNGYYGGSQAMD